MNWVKQNRFLTALLAVLAIGIGALGFLAFSASGAYEEASNRYTDTSNEFNRLRRLQPFPSKKNLEKFAAQKLEATEVINAFQADLAKKEFPLEPMTPEQFQDKLKASVSAVRAKAKEGSVKLGDKESEKFYLGFDRYETTPPERNAAAALGRQLKAIEWVAEQAIGGRVAELRLTRAELPEEKARTAKPGETGGKGRDARRPKDTRGGSGTARQELVTYHPFDVIIIGKQSQVANLLNTVVSPKAPQFYVPRAIRIRNEKPTGPPRSVEPVDPANSKPPEFLVGNESIEAAIRFEMVDFAEVGSK